MIKRHIALALLVCSLCVWISGHEAVAAAPAIRVAVTKDTPQLTVFIRGPYRILDRHNNAVLAEERTLRKTSVTVTENGIRCGTDEFLTDGIKIIPRRDASIYIDGRRYSGEIDIKRRSNDAIVAINIVDLERYIKGVLYHEVSHRWPIETLKAQAVAARTYALYRMQVNKDADYDVTSDIYSQVYGGKSSERYRTNIAVNRTKDLVMTYNGKILPAYYHATCGGMTENAGALWEHAIPPLRGVRCPFCRQSPHFQWKKNFRLKDIQDKLNARGYDIGLIKTIEVIERNPSGRITTLRITARDGKTITIAGKDFRDIIGPNIIKSNNYEVVMQGYYMDLLGKGWGHGVGMCQWGAYFMAQQRYRYDAILQYYYPGMAITDYHRLNLD